MLTTSYTWSGTSQALSSGFSAAAAARTRVPKFQALVEWDRDSGNWVDESNQLLSVGWEWRIEPPGADLLPPGENGRATVTLRNQGWRYSWKRSSGNDNAIRAYITGPSGLKGKRIILRAGFEVSGAAELVNVFAGIIEDWTESSDGKTVTLVCADAGAELVQMRKSAVMTEDTNASAWIQKLATELAGMNAGDLVLDTALLRIPYAWMDDDPVLEDMWMAAASEGGRARFDVNGKLRFEAADHWARPDNQTIRWTFDGDDYKRIEPAWTTDALATELVVEWAERRPDKESVVYTLDRAKIIRPNDSITFEARLTYPVVSLEPLEEEKDYLHTTPSGHPMNQSCTITLDAKAQRVNVTISNSNATMAAVLTFFQLRGRPLTGGPTQQEDLTITPSPLKYDRVRSVRGNTYIQTHAHANMLLPYMEQYSKQVLPIYRLVEVWAVPHLELGDRVQYTDNRSLDSTRTGFVIGIEGKYSKDAGFKQDITIMDDADWLGGHTYFVIGETALGAGEAWH